MNGNPADDPRFGVTADVVLFTGEKASSVLLVRRRNDPFRPIVIAPA